MRRKLFLALPLLAACTTAPSPTATPLPAAPAAPTALETTVPATESAECSDEAQFLEDLTIPDGSQLAAGEQAVKQWLVLNAGTCNWTNGYRLIRTDATSLVASAELALYPTRAGEQAMWEIVIEAPQAAGEYQASWQAQAPDGSLFGDPVFVLIQVSN